MGLGALLQRLAAFLFVFSPVIQLLRYLLFVRQKEDFSFICLFLYLELLYCDNQLRFQDSLKIRFYKNVIVSKDILGSFCC